MLAVLCFIAIPVSALLFTVPASVAATKLDASAKQVGAERYNLFTGCPKAKTATMVLRGGSEQFIDEAERSLHDAIMIVRRAMKNACVVPGGGAIDMEISK